MMSCNINQTDRINRIVVGIVLILAAVLGASKWFFIILGVILTLSGVFGLCSIPLIMEKLKRK